MTGKPILKDFSRESSEPCVLSATRNKRPNSEGLGKQTSRIKVVTKPKQLDGTEFSGPHVVCVVTGRPNSTLHHILTQKTHTKFKNEKWNQLPLCHELHVEIHLSGLNAFVKKYPVAGNWLRSQGWSYCPFRQRWVRDE